ncbi:MAG: hypothetical protein C0501_26385 [Isosphaera sp.]|nr:hypothetical protein [Isosphaera sp.]
MRFRLAVLSCLGPGVVLPALLLAPGPTPAQYDPGPAAGGPRERRAAREWAVARLGGGPEARRLVEDHGEAAVRAVAACSPEVGRKLAAWHADPDGLGRLPRPADLLRAVGDGPRGGADLACWAIANGPALRDPDAFEALLRDPLELVMGLKPLAQAAAEHRAARLARAEGGRWLDDPFHVRVATASLAAAALVLLAAWVRNRRRGRDER